MPLFFHLITFLFVIFPQSYQCLIFVDRATHLSIKNKYGVGRRLTRADWTCRLTPFQRQQTSIRRRTQLRKSWRLLDPPIYSSTQVSVTLIDPSVVETSPFICQQCSSTFSSRNALFRHLRQIHNPSHDMTMEDARKSVALLFTYDSYVNHSSTVSSCNTTKSEVEQIGDTVLDAFLFALQQYYIDDSTTHSTIVSRGDGQPRILSSTQCTVPRMRHISLSQEAGCSSCGDVLSIAYTIPSSTYEESKEEESKRIHSMIHVANQYLSIHVGDSYPFSSSSSSSHRKPITSQVSHVAILAATSMPYRKYFHTEKSCTQKAYHYLVPLRWLPDGKDIEQWKLESTSLIQTQKETSSSSSSSIPRMKTRFGLSKRWEPAVVQPPPSSTLKIFKTALRAVESSRLYNYSSLTRTLSNEQDDNKQEADETIIESLSTRVEEPKPRVKLAMGRYGSLAYKEKKCWHNYADPTLEGAISPNHEPVWRATDRCRIVQLFSYESNVHNHKNSSKVDDSNSKQVVALIEFRGDDFLPQQVRRIVATAVAMTHGWLPKNFIEYSTQPDVFIETPMAPPDRLYFAGARFHWEELENEGRGIFDHSQLKGDTSEEKIIMETQHRLLNRCQDRDEDEAKWLEELRDVIAPRIRMQMNQQASDGKNRFQGDQHTTEGTVPHPMVYNTTLSLLRRIKNHGLWPTTSSARSKVIKNMGENNGGSFTVLNPTFEDGLLFRENYNISIPMGNVLFPDLVEAVFELERLLSTSLQQSQQISPYRREHSSSSHCAINCNAQFTPHVDSGRGSGQSLSLIVGLGDYHGGEILVEGDAHDIQYKPLEFNGWRQRHWTAPFQGERFSLVWFTPEMASFK